MNFFILLLLSIIAISKTNGIIAHHHQYISEDVNERIYEDFLENFDIKIGEEQEVEEEEEKHICTKFCQVNEEKTLVGKCPIDFKQNMVLCMACRSPKTNLCSKHFMVVGKKK